MKLEDYDYELPKDQIAQRPLAKRADSRLLLVDRSKGGWEDLRFIDVVEYFKPGDALVLNDTKVIPARIIGKKPTGGRVEILLLSPEGEGDDSRKWKVLARPTLKEGQEVLFGAGHSKATCLGRGRENLLVVEFSGGDVMDFARMSGTTPLPPYIRREPEESDKDRYQTVYAAQEGAVAAPTAGLHFTKDILDEIRQKGVHIVNVTLHVGYGTFKPVVNLDTHIMHSETFEICSCAAETLNDVLASGRKIWAVGTTAVRVLETCALNQRVLAGKGETDLFLRPPQEIEVVGGLLTNFHWPRSTLLMLVSAFAGTELIQKAYRHAVKEGYRFFSYGDCMLIL